MSLPALKLVRPAALLNTATLPISVDFGAASLKVLQIEGGEPPSLIAAACVDTPDDLLADAPKRLAFQIHELPKLIRSGSFKGKRAVCSIPASQMFCKHLQFPRTENADLGSMVRQAVSQQLGCHAEALLYRHVEVAGTSPGGGATSGGTASAGTGPKSEVICLAVSRELIGRLMEALRASKLEPVGIQPECLAILRAFDPLTRRTGDQDVTTLYLDLGAGSTNVLVAHGRDLVFAKTIQQGGLRLDEAIARQLKCSLAWARSQRIVAQAMMPTEATAPADPSVEPAPGTPGPEIVNAAQTDGGKAAPKFDLREPLDSLTDEIAGCLRYHGSLFPGRRVNRTIFVGGEARQRSLCQHIARTLRLPAQVADPMARIARTGNEPCKGFETTSPQPGWAVPVGLALSPTDL